MISYTMPVYKGANFIGVIGVDIPFDAYKGMVLAIKIDKTRDAFLLNDKKSFLVSTSFTIKDNFGTVANNFFQEQVKEIDKADSGMLQWTFDGVVKFASFSHLSNGDILVITVPRNEVLAELNGLTTLLMIIILLGILISALVAWFLGARISKPILKVTELINKTAQFDLAYDKSLERFLNNKDETGVMFRALASMRKALREMVSSIIKWMESNRTKRTN
jgi:methyl-accepting chemotaxis protein